MKNQKLYSTLTIFLIFIGFSCKLEKRIYNQGFYLEKHSIYNTQKPVTGIHKSVNYEIKESRHDNQIQPNFSLNGKNDLSIINHNENHPDTLRKLDKLIDQSIAEKKNNYYSNTCKTIFTSFACLRYSYKNIKRNLQ